MFEFLGVFGFAGIAIIVLLVIYLFSAGYVKAPPDTAFIISGFRKEPKVLIGRAGFKIPFFERKDTLLIKQITVDIKTQDYIPTLDFIGVNIDAVAKIRVDTDKDGIALAMKNFLNMKEEKIVAALTDSLQGNMREIIGTVRLKDLCTDRKKFGDEVQEKAQKDMNALGIKIISCNIQSIEDEKGLIVALGQDNMSQIQKDASIAKAQAERDVVIAEAEAKKIANEAKVESDLEIAEKQNALAIRKSELQLQADAKRAEADASYKIREQEQRRSIETAAVNADIARTEREADLKVREVEVTKSSLDATVRAKADAERYKAQQEAEVELFRRQKEAEARQFEMERDAEARRISADADKYKAEQEAAATRAKGLAEAEAIRAKGLAEAEATEKKAEAMAKMKEAAILEMYFKVLPDIAGKVAEPLKSIDKITMFGEGNTAKMVGDIVTSTTQITDGLSQGLGFDVKSMLMGALGTKMLTGSNQQGVNLQEVENLVKTIQNPNQETVETTDGAAEVVED